MCGICGVAGFENPALVRQMAGLLQHRGPDDEGFYFSKDIGLGHRRLSIIDLKSGHQPIFNEDKTIAIIFNGEIYNFRALKSDLEKKGHKFQTRTDTEVIVHAYEEMGDACVESLNGEFAFALWDEKKRRLLLARDRLGIRPLYYCLKGQNLLFSSELKSLLISNLVPRELNPAALDAYLTLRYIPSSMTLFSSIHKIPPGSIAVYEKNQFHIKRYWKIDDFSVPKKNLSESECVEKFSELFEESIRLRLMSDVPLGAYLSGGIDSSLIVGWMSRLSTQPVKTFTVGGFGSAVDELEKARFVAQYFKTEHHELKIGRQSFDLLPKIMRHMDSPVGDSIIIPLYLLAQETSKHVKVVLSGDGADEVMAGYVHHLALYYGNLYRCWTPRVIKALFVRFIQILPAAFLNRFFPYPADLGEKGKKRVIKYLNVLSNKSPAECFLELVSLFSSEEKKEIYHSDYLASQGKVNCLEETMNARLKSGANFLNSLINNDLESWLPDNTLIKQDHLTMAHSLEARAPFLDHRLVEFCASLPVRFKIRGLTQKFLLRQAGKRILPQKTVVAPKQAFYFPVEQCFGNQFDDYVRDVFHSESFKSRGIFKADWILKNTGRIRSPELLENKQIMAALVLELWFREFVDTPQLSGVCQ